MEYALPVEIPEDAIVKSSITIASFFGEDGKIGYVYKCHGDEPMSSYLGLLVIAQRDILAWSEHE